VDGSAEVMTMAFYTRWLDQAAWDEDPDADQADYIETRPHQSLDDAKAHAFAMGTEHGNAEVWCDFGHYADHELVAEYVDGDLAEVEP
jgi:hypothetical protein